MKMTRDFSWLGGMGLHRAPDFGASRIVLIVQSGSMITAVACRATLAEYEGPGYLHEGFAVTADYPDGEDYEWVCSNCFDALGDQMGWISVD
jgi:hypothetical protein